MTKRDMLREQFIMIIEEHLKDNLESSTIKYYQMLIDSGLEHERAIERLAFYCEIYVGQNSHEESHDSEKWKCFLEQIPVVVEKSDYEFDSQDERQNIRKIQRQYGKIKKDTKLFEEELFVLEKHFLVLAEHFFISDLELKKIIHIVINRILDFMNDESSDYSTYAHEDLLSLATGIEQCCNPYINSRLYKYLENDIDLNDKDNYEKIFKNVLLCLARILESIDFWHKELGSNGYFHFIGQFIDSDEPIFDGPEFFFNEKTLDKNLK